MDDISQIIFIIVFTLAIIIGTAIGIYFLIKKLNKKGTCIFFPFTQKKETNTAYIQTGYISCSGGGLLWKPNKISVLNTGPGTFYIGPIQGETSLLEIDSGNTLSFSMSNNIIPGVYYDSSSTNITPNFTITLI